MWPAASPRPLAGLHVLLADDSESILLAYGDVLRRAGAAVTTASDGAGALTVFEEAGRSERPFDAVLLDYQMPTLDGQAAAAQLRATGFEGPIVGISAEMSGDVEDRWLAAGCDRVLSKGQSSDDLIACVASACGRGF